MIRVLLIDPTTKQVQEGDRALLPVYQGAEKQFVWVDLEDPTSDEVTAILREFFKFDELAIQDSLPTKRHPPKVEAFPNNYMLVVLRMVASDVGADLETKQFSIFVGDCYIVTIKPTSSESVARIWQLIREDRKIYSRGPKYILYRLLQLTSTRYLEYLDRVEEKLEEVEDDIFSRSDDRSLEQLIDYSTNLRKAARVLNYHQVTTKQLLSLPGNSFSTVEKHEFRDAHDQMERAYSKTNLLLGLVTDLTQGYLSLSSHRVNRIVRVLTTATVLFLPLTLIVGVYGMNFEHMPELHWKYGYFVVLGAMVGIEIGLLFVLRKLKWI